MASRAVLIVINPASANMNFYVQFSQRVIHFDDVIAVTEIEPEPLND
jgi:hypothetical protein